MKTRYYTDPFHRKGLLQQFMLAIILSLSSQSVPGQIAAWNFENISAAVPSLPIAASSKDPRVRASATLSGGNNNGSPDACSGNEAWSTNFWPTGSSRDPGSYIQFSVRADPGEYFEIDRFSFRSNASSGNSALKFAVYYSKNNFTTSKFLFSGTQSTGSCSSHGGSVGVPLNAGTTIKFRIYPYGQNVAAQAATIRIDNVSVTGSLLPVSLRHFSGEQTTDHIKLQWITASEINNDHFVVERSRNGIDFESIGQVAGAGNSQSEKQYLFTDYQPFPADNYYRLRQVDFDGTEAVHPIVHIYFEASDKAPAFEIWPTVTSAYLHVKIGGETMTGPGWVRNIQGRVVSTFFPPAEGGVFQISVMELPVGWYVVQYPTSGRLLSRRFFRP